MKSLTTILLSLTSIYAAAQTEHLAACWEKQAAFLSHAALEIKYEEQFNRFYHSKEPWEQLHYMLKGTACLNGNSFHQNDTLFTSRRNYVSKTALSDSALWHQDYGDTALSEVTESSLARTKFKTLRYSPFFVLRHFYENKDWEYGLEEEWAVFTGWISGAHVQLYIDRHDYLVREVRVTSAGETDDELYGLGDVEDLYRYHDFSTADGSYYPKRIEIHKLNGRLKDTVLVKEAKLVGPCVPSIANMKSVPVQKDTVALPDITVEKFSEHIYLVNMHHCGTRSIVVEFSDFLLVAESPLNSRQGDLLLAEVKRINPHKPVRYFVFGHFHPHYTGGIRPFIHGGAKVICTREDEAYIKYIAEVLHSQIPDSLYHEPRTLVFDFVEEQKVITDGNYETVIYHIGSESNHTNDYLIYYFPQEKMIFEDDLVWINEKTTRETLPKTTSGFYEAVKKRNLDVETVIQNWSVLNKKDRMIFDFKDLEALMSTN